jgi:AcrR family transcriptional regulator
LGTIEHRSSVSPTESSKPDAAKAPRTARGERTLRKILDAALDEFGEKGFSDGSIVGITTRAHVALGTFYTYFDSKEAVFKALVRDMSEQVRTRVAAALSSDVEALERERWALTELLRLIGEHKSVYRIIDEAEFVDPEGYRRHYEDASRRILARLREGADRGQLRREESALAEEIVAWAMMGANVFIGLRFAVWDTEDSEEVAKVVSRLWRLGMKA